MSRPQVLSDMSIKYLWYSMFSVVHKHWLTCDSLSIKSLYQLNPYDIPSLMWSTTNIDWYDILYQLNTKSISKTVPYFFSIHVFRKKGEKIIQSSSYLFPIFPHLPNHRHPLNSFPIHVFLEKGEKNHLQKFFIYLPHLSVLGKPSSKRKYTRGLGARIRRSRMRWKRKRREDRVPGKKSARERSSGKVSMCT